MLKKRPRPRVWILVAGDEAKELWGYVRSLTYGNQRALDIPAFTLALGAERENAQYMKQWQALGAAMPYVLSYLDVRIIEITPRLALSIARSFGTYAVTSVLQSQAGDRDAAVALLRESVLGELLLRAAPVDRSAPRKTEPASSEEYNRLQALAPKKRDGEIHEAFKDALAELLKADASVLKVVSGKRIDSIGLVPDIYIEMAAADPVCLEFTWRTSKPQKTYTPGHIQQYVLNKVFDYVSALGLEKLLDALNVS